MTFEMDITYGFDQIVIEFSPWDDDTLLLCDILKIFPEEHRITHIFGSHTGQYDIYDMYRHKYDGFITGYGNERLALLFHH